jgi:hypothetical protein
LNDPSDYECEHNILCCPWLVVFGIQS